MPRYDYSCSCGSVVEEVRGYDDAVIPCASCGGSARRVPVYHYQSLRGDTVPRGAASRAGNIKDTRGRYRVSLYREAAEEAAETAQQRAEAGLPAGPDPYTVALRRAAARGVKLNAQGRR